MSANESLRQNREREFQKRVLAALEKPKGRRLWAVLNAPFTLWILSLFIISLFGSYLNSYQQCTKDADDGIERSTKIARELFQRELRIQTIIMTKPSVAEIRQELQKPNAYYPELAGLSIDILRETYASLMNRVMGVNGVPLTKEQVSLLPLYSISRGIIPPEISDKDIPKMREYAEQMLARAWPLPLPGFG